MKKLLFSAFVCALGSTVSAQSAFVVTGGDISNPNGTINYSIGQVFFTTEDNPQLSLSEGLQSPYEVVEDVVTGIEDVGIKLSVSTYPNPVKDILTIETPDDLVGIHNLNYVLYSINGTIVSSGKIGSAQVEVDMQSLPSSTYVLMVLKEAELLKSFMIIKN